MLQLKRLQVFLFFCISKNFLGYYEIGLLRLIVVE